MDHLYYFCGTIFSREGYALEGSRSFNNVTPHLSPYIGKRGKNENIYYIYIFVLLVFQTRQCASVSKMIINMMPSVVSDTSILVPCTSMLHYYILHYSYLFFSLKLQNNSDHEQDCYAHTIKGYRSNDVTLERDKWRTLLLLLLLLRPPTVQKEETLLNHKK